MTAVLAGSLYATLHTAFKARRSAGAAVEQMRRAEFAVEMMRTDIESAVVPKGILAGSFLGEDATDGAGQPMDGLALHCTASGAEGTGDIRMVELACEADDDGEGMVLLRRVNYFLLASTVREPQAEVLCRGVRWLDFKYHDGTEWQDSWDSTARGNVLPLAVQVTLELVPEADGQADDTTGYRALRVLPIACGAIPDDTQR